MTIYMDMTAANIHGNVSAKGHQHWIECHALTFDISRQINNTAGKMTDRIQSQPQFSDIEIIKSLDQSSAKLFQLACDRQVLPQVTIHLCASDSDSHPYACYQLENILIKHHQHTATAASQPTEILQLSFTQLTLTYNGDQQPQIAGYDLTTMSTL